MTQMETLDGRSATPGAVERATRAQIANASVLTPDAHIPHVTATLQARIKQVVEQHLGMKVATVTVQAQLEPLAGVHIPQRPQTFRRVLR